MTVWVVFQALRDGDDYCVFRLIGVYETLAKATAAQPDVRNVPREDPRWDDRTDFCPGYCVEEIQVLP